MLTRIEIDGFKTFEDFALDLQPFSAVVGPNASGKSNLFDAIKFISLLAQGDVRSAMLELRGEPEELFRWTPSRRYQQMKFAVEAFLSPTGSDAFGKKYRIKAQRLRYELRLTMKLDAGGYPAGVYVSHEACHPIAKTYDRAEYLKQEKAATSYRRNPFIDMDLDDKGQPTAFNIRQDGPANDAGTSKRGRPVKLPAFEAGRTALSTIATAEFPHLYALRDLLTSIRFLEINPRAARRAVDRFDTKILKSDASNLAAVLARLQQETGSAMRPAGVMSDIAADLSSLIPSVRAIEIHDYDGAKEHSFSVRMADDLTFSSRVISDGTLRLLALLALLDDPDRKGILCFEEPENGVHEGRIPALVQLLRDSVWHAGDAVFGSLFQVLVNTHSPAVMAALQDSEIIAADTVSSIEPATQSKSTRTRMRTGIESGKLDLDPETDLSRREIGALLKKLSEEA
ncbi:AAA family ATPase [Brevundimonas fluminis]|uniref:AAA family ATPase n=1 Tax=Brevundimonas fluminis TaxID=2487274 RepID=UPI000F657052|nr:AAA family ATPase [Brevundimonas fluminis]